MLGIILKNSMQTEIQYRGEIAWSDSVDKTRGYWHMNLASATFTLVISVLGWVE